MVKIMKKFQRKSLKPNHKGGAVYTFNLDDKIGGLPARIPLNGTQDGDCPASDVNNLGMVNYGAASGGARKHRRNSRSNSYKKHKSHNNKSRKNNSRNNKSRKHRSRNNKNNTRKNNSIHRK